MTVTSDSNLQALGPPIGRGSVADDFTTVLYGIAATQVALVGAGHCRGNENLATAPAVVALAIILYLLVDWFSRVYLPSRLPREDRDRIEITRFRIAKSALEVALVYTLLLVFLGVLASKAGSPVDVAVWDSPDVVFPFAAFLVLTFLWNLLMLGIMMRLKWEALARYAWRGTAAEEPDFQEYGRNLKQRLKSLDDAVGKLTKVSDGVRSSIVRSIVGFRALLESIAQLIVNHLVWSPIFATATLIVSLSLLGGAAILDTSALRHFLLGEIRGYIVVAIFVLWVTWLIACLHAHSCIKKNERIDNGTSMVTGLLLFGLIGFAILSIAISALTQYGSIFWFLVALVILPAIPGYFRSRSATTAAVRPAGSGRNLSGVLSISILTLTYLCLSAGEVVLFCIVESIVVCLFLSFSAPATTNHVATRTVHARSAATCNAVIEAGVSYKPGQEAPTKAEGSELEEEKGV